MLITRKKRQEASDPITRIYEDLEAELMANIVRHIRDYGRPVDSDQWRLEKLGELGGLNRENIRIIAESVGASQAEARYAAEWLEAIGALNDADYAAILVRHCAGLGYGPARIREKLREKGVPRELWDEALDQATDSAEQIDRFLAAKLRGRAPEEAEKRRLTSALLRRGFAWGDVRAAWGRLGAEIPEE